MTNFKTKKSLGQHFLHDQNIIGNILIHANNIENYNVLEIGSGKHALTKHLVKYAKTVVALEKDTRLKAELQTLKQSSSNFSYILADATMVSPKDVINPLAILISNLPYNVGTQIFLKYLIFCHNNPNYFAYFILMFQKEVALRITANVGDNNYGRLSIISYILADIIYLFDVYPESFTPPPAVTSGVIKVKPLLKPRYNVDLKKLEQITNLAFMGKRKTIRNSLKSLNIDFTALNINSSCRAEELTPQEFCLIANSL